VWIEVEVGLILTVKDGVGVAMNVIGNEVAVDGGTVPMGIASDSSFDNALSIPEVE
jgi:hypothetical protein